MMRTTTRPMDTWRPTTRTAALRSRPRTLHYGAWSGRPMGIPDGLMGAVVLRASGAAWYVLAVDGGWLARQRQA